MNEWIWQANNWTNFTWKDEIILPKTRKIRIQALLFLDSLT